MVTRVMYGQKRSREGSYIKVWKGVIEVHKKEEVVKFYLPDEPTIVALYILLLYRIFISSPSILIIFGLVSITEAYSTFALLKTTP